MQIIGKMFLDKLQTMVDQVKIYTKEIEDQKDRERLVRE
jgi:hypothetical protein